MQPDVDEAVEPTVAYADNEDSEGSGGSERLKGSHLEIDSGDNIFDVDKEVKKVIYSSDDDIKLDTTQLTNYLEEHEYKMGIDGKHRLKLRHVFREIVHFREILNEVIVRKGFAIKTVYSASRRFHYPSLPRLQVLYN